MKPKKESKILTKEVRSEPVQRPLSITHPLTETVLLPHYANTPMQYTAIFHGCKNVHFQMIFLNIFLNFAQDIDCGYTLEPPQ